MFKKIGLLFVLTFAAHALAAEKVDVCIYGGTAGGVAAAVTVSKEGKSVILIEPGRHLGGMSSGGLGQTDFGNKQVIGGLSRQFYKRVGKFYGQEEGWQFQPHHAEAVFEEWVKENKLRVVREQRLKSVRKEGKRIAAIVLEKAPTDETNAQVANAIGEGLEIEAKVFIDATYEGDLMARAGVSYMVGRESSAQYGEPLNGIRARTPLHQFLTKVDPYVTPGDPGSGFDLGLGVGIAQGYATLGAIGFEGRWDYAAIGNVTNLSARLCAEAKAGQILADRKTMAVLDGVFDFEPVGELTLKGFSHPVPGFALKNRGRTPT